MSITKSLGKRTFSDNLLGIHATRGQCMTPQYIDAACCEIRLEIRATNQQKITTAVILSDPPASFALKTKVSLACAGVSAELRIF